MREPWTASEAGPAQTAPPRRPEQANNRAYGPGNPGDIGFFLQEHGISVEGGPIFGHSAATDAGFEHRWFQRPKGSKRLSCIGF